MTDQNDDYQIAKRKTKATRLKWAKKCYAGDIAADKYFQRHAAEDFAFVAGRQWKAETVAAMKLAGREPLVFNVVKPICDLIGGIREQNEVDATAQPTEINDEFLVEILNKLSEKVRNLYNIHNEEVETFDSAKECGRGFIGLDVRLDPANPTEIRLDVQSVPVWEVRLDPAGRKDDLSDHSRISWTRWFSKENFCASYPKFRKRIDDIMQGSAGATDSEFAVDYDDMGESDFIEVQDGLVANLDDYNVVLDDDYIDMEEERVKVCHMEYREDYDRYYGFNPITGKTEEFEKENLQPLKERLPKFDWFTVRDVKTKWLQWVGNVVLYDGDSPMPFEGFSITPMFAYKERTPAGFTHFGIVRPLKDPQREFNKRWSQELHLLMNQDQGGNFIESDAILNMADYQNSKYIPGADTLLKPGGLGKIREKGLPQASPLVAKMKSDSMDIIKRISGVNPDLMGEQGTRQEPGIVVRLRQQQGLTILAPLFRSYKSMKKQFAEKLIAVIMKYMPDSQIRRILGDDENVIIREGVVVDKKRGLIAPLRDIRNVKYNIDIEESPANMTRAMYELSIFFESLEKGLPVPPELIIEKMDLPITEKRTWLEWVAKQQQGAQQEKQIAVQLKTKEMDQKAQADMARIQIEAEDKRVSHIIDMAKLDQEDQQFALELLADVVGKMVERKNAMQQQEMAAKQPVAQGGRA